MQCLATAHHIIAICSVPSETANGVTMKCVEATNTAPNMIEIGNAGNAFWKTPRNISVKHSPWPQDAEQSEPHLHSHRRTGGQAGGRVQTQTLAERTVRIATKEAVAVATPYLEPLATSTL
jgi:hypothetical protein